MINLSNFEILEMKESKYNYRFLIKSNISPLLELAGILVLLVYHQLQDHFQRYGLFHMQFNPILHNFSRRYSACIFGCCHFSFHSFTTNRL